jgi:hypothetical protein
MAASLVDVHQFEKLRPSEPDKVEEGGGSERWKMSGFWFTTSAFAAGAVFPMGVIMGYDGCSNLGFTCQEQMMGVCGRREDRDRPREREWERVGRTLSLVYNSTTGIVHTLNRVAGVEAGINILSSQ